MTISKKEVMLTDDESNSEMFDDGMFKTSVLDSN